MIGRRIAILGATGALGSQALDLVRRFRADFTVAGLAAGGRRDELARLCQEFSPHWAALHSREDAEWLSRTLPPGRFNVFAGNAGLAEALSQDLDLVVSAIGGTAALRPLWQAVQPGRIVAVASKEALVMAGQLLLARARELDAELLPVDSEHVALSRLLQARPGAPVRRLWLTATGGPLLGRHPDSWPAVTPEEACAHPVWRMGKKISVDSATLMNKAIEIIEAHLLFGIPLGDIGVLIHPAAALHGMVEFADGVTLAYAAPPDMRVPLAQALWHPEASPLETAALPVEAWQHLTLEEADPGRWPALGLAARAHQLGPAGYCILVAADEVAAGAFLENRLTLDRVVPVVTEALHQCPKLEIKELEDVERQAELAAATASQVIARHAVRA